MHTVHGEKSGAEPSAGLLRRWPAATAETAVDSHLRERPTRGGVRSQRGFGACGAEPSGGHCPAPASAPPALPLLTPSLPRLLEGTQAPDDPAALLTPAGPRPARPSSPRN